MSSTPQRFYAQVKEVRERFPGAEREISDSRIIAGLRVASAVINAAARKGGYSPVPFDCSNVPELIAEIAKEYAAGWVMTRPGFAAATEEVPENGKLWMDWAKEQLALLTLGELDLGLEIEETGDQVGVLSSGLVNGERERIKQFPRYSPPVYPVDPLPTSHPQLGRSYNRARYGGMP